MHKDNRCPLCGDILYADTDSFTFIERRFMETEMKKFNLVDDPWIKVTGRELQSLKMLFSDLTLARLSGNAVEKIAVLRFLLALTYAAVEVPDTASWQALTPEQISRSVLEYLEHHHDTFELFGEKPFLQFPVLAKSEKKQPYSVLSPSTAVGNKPVLTNWNLPVSADVCELPLFLLRGCGFGMGGKKFDNSLVLTGGYVGKFNDKGKPASGSNGALLGFQGYLHSYLQGDTILETIHLNMLTAEEVAEMGVFPGGMGRPAWEHMPLGEDCPRAREYKESFQGILLPLDKFYLLLPAENKIVMTDGIRYPSHLTGLKDPALRIFQKGKDIKAVWAKTAVRPWRELSAILSFLKAVDSNRDPYFLSCGIAKLPATSTVHVWTGGVEVSSNAGEQYVSGKNDYIESDFYFPVEYLAAASLDKYENIMTEIESLQSVLYKSVSGYFKELQNLSGADIASAASAVFWEMMERDVPQIIEAAFSENIVDDVAPQELVKRWRRLVLDLYDRNCPCATARQLEAWCKHKPFAYTKKKTTKKG